MKKINRFWILVALLLLASLILVLNSKVELPQKMLNNLSQPIKIGYFHGGRTMLLYRAYINDEFEKGGSSVALISYTPGEDDFQIVPKNFDEIKKIKNFGDIEGEKLIKEVVKGKFVAATTGEGSFIKAVTGGAPIVAVARLGHDLKEKPAHAIVIRKGLTIKNPADFKNKIFATRRAGDGDKIFLREFLISIGLDLKDVKIIDEVIDEDLQNHLKEGTVDAAYLHLVTTEKMVNAGTASIYRKLDWINPELSQALLVFHRDFVKDHPEEIRKIIKTYMKRVRYEHSLTKTERLHNSGLGKKGLQMEKDFQGMNLPQYDYPPLVPLELLNQMQDLSLKHGYIDKKVDLSNFIDNSFVEKVQSDLGD